MKRFARWLRLVVACLAFVIGAPAPAALVDAFDTVVVMVADDGDPSDETSAEEIASASELPKCARATRDVATDSSVDAPHAFARLYLANCALLL